VALITITNLTNERILIQEMYTHLGAGKSLTTTRERDELHAMPRLQQLWEDGVVTVVVTSDTAEQGFIDQYLHTVGPAALYVGAPEDVDASPAVVGVQSTASRGDHKHDVATASAVELTDTTNGEGTSDSLARADHLHAHGDRAGGTLHALATTTVPGFMSDADKTKIDGLLTSSTKTWSFETNNTGADYIGGFYDFATTDDDFSPSINFGDVNRSVAAHFMIVTGAITVDQVQVTVTGTSITDAGVRTASDTEIIIIPISTAVDTYFETSKKWNGQVSVETTAGTAVTCNYGWCKYHDSGNTDFTLTGLEALWTSESTDTASDLAVLHHKATGWTFNAGSTPTPPTALARRSTDHGVENGHQDGAPGAWKRTNINQAIAGSASEGLILEVTSAQAGVGNQSFRQLNFEISVKAT
jgi:hypothetical protein